MSPLASERRPMSVGEIVAAMNVVGPGYPSTYADGVADLRPLVAPSRQAPVVLGDV